MAFNINEFASNGLVLGGARPTQFSVDLFPPFASTNSARIKFMVNATSLPGMYIDNVPVAYFGRQIKFNGDRVFQDWRVSVLNDEDFPVRAILERWSNEINTLVSNRLDPARYATGYKRTAEVTQYGKDGRTLRLCRMYGLFPTQIEDLQNDWGATNQIQTFGVTFSIDYWETINHGMALDTYNALLPDDGSFSGTPPATTI